MAEENLNDAGIDAVIEEATGEGMTEAVGGDAFGEAGELPGLAAAERAVRVMRARSYSMTRRSRLSRTVTIPTRSEGAAVRVAARAAARLRRRARRLQLRST